MSDYYRRLQQDCLVQNSGDKRTAVDCIYDELRGAAQAGSLEADAILGRATRAGIRKDLDDFCRSAEGRLALTIIGASDPIKDSVPASKSIHRRLPSGEIEQLELTFLDMLFAEIRQKLAEMGYQRDRLYTSIVAAARFLELETAVPGARSPREALDRLGVTTEEWLSQSRAI